MKEKFTKELNAGTVSLIVLAILEKIAKPMYGYMIAKALEPLRSSGDPGVKKGTIYPVLRSLERNGLLVSTVEPSVSGPPRKYYSITESGRSELREWKAIWQETRDMVDRVLDNKITVSSEDNRIEISSTAEENNVD